MDYVDAVKCNPSWASVVRIHLALLRLERPSSEAARQAEAEIIRCAALTDKLLFEHTDYFDFTPVGKGEQLDMFKENENE